MRAFVDRPGVIFRAMLTGWLAGVVLCLSALPVYAGALEEGLQNPRVAEIITTGVRERPTFLSFTGTATAIYRLADAAFA